MPDLLGGIGYTWPWYATGFAAYLVGSVPFGLLLTKWAGLGDIRHVGSGNIGATNVMRTGRRGLAGATLLLDGAKGALAVLAAGYYGPDFKAIAAVGVVVGHMAPIWLRFRGGKGVATSLGVMFALSWPVAIAACLTWLALVVTTRISSVGALVAIPLAPVYLVLILYGQGKSYLPYWLPGLPQFVEVLGLIAVLVLLKHIGNVKRLIVGTEPRIGNGSKSIRS